MTPSWYDVLDVDEDATPAEIRTAWKAAIADLDPGDRRFRLANQAAEVLLDPRKRAAHDEALAAEVDATDDDATAVETPQVRDGADRVDEVDEVDETGESDDVHGTDEVDDGDDDPDDDPDDDADDTDTAGEARPSTAGRRRPAPALLALVLVAVLLLALTVVALVQGRDAADSSRGTLPDLSSGRVSDRGAESTSGLPDERRIQDARGAAEAAVVPVLAYDYRTLEEDAAEARTYLTDDYATEYDRFFAAAVETNAPRTQTVVRVRVLDSAIVRTGQDRVDVLLFVNRPTTNRQRSVEYRDQVTMRMLEVDGTWLVDCMITTGTGPCEGD